MKKLILIIITATVMLSLFACDVTDGNDTTNPVSFPEASSLEATDPEILPSEDSKPEETAPESNDPETNDPETNTSETNDPEASKDDPYIKALSLPISPDAVESLTVGMTYDEVVAILGADSTDDYHEDLWAMSDGRILRVSFVPQKSKYGDDLPRAIDIYVMTKTSTGIKRPSDPSQVEKLMISAGCGFHSLDISDNSEAIQYIVGKINAAEPSFVDSSRGYYGAQYNLSFYNSEGECFTFTILADSAYFTNEYTDGDQRYSMMAYADLTELLSYLNEHYPESSFHGDDCTDQ